MEVTEEHKDIQVKVNHPDTLPDRHSLNVSLHFALPDRLALGPAARARMAIPNIGYGRGDGMRISKTPFRRGFVVVI